MAAAAAVGGLKPKAGEAVVVEEEEEEEEAEMETASLVAGGAPKRKRASQLGGAVGVEGATLNSSICLSMHFTPVFMLITVCGEDDGDDFIKIIMDLWISTPRTSQQR